MQVALYSCQGPISLNMDGVSARPLFVACSVRQGGTYPPFVGSAVALVYRHMLEPWWAMSVST